MAASISSGELLLRLSIAALLGAVLGWERELRAKSAGLRTHMLVTLGAAVFALLGVEVLTASAGEASARIDPSRVLEGIVGGIGFLGAGSIIQSRGQVEGLTTAAGVWISGAIGAACGLGMFRIAAIAAGFAFVTIAGLGWLEGRLRRRRRGKSESTDDDGDDDQRVS